MRETSAPALSQLALLVVASAALGAVLAACSACAQPLAIAAGAGLFAVQGLALALLAWGLCALATWLGARTGRRLDAHALIALFVAVAALGPGFELFSGHGVRRTALGAYGPYLFALLAGAAGWMASRRVVPTLQRGRGWRPWSLALLFLALLPPLVFLGRVSYPGLYRGVHTALAAAVGALGMLAALPLAQRALPRWLAFALIALACGGAAASALAFGRDNRERKCLEGSSELAYLASYLRERVDLDGDGASALFGGGDCADWDGRVGPAAVDRPGDGRDSDCDGRDGGPPVVASGQRRFRGDPAAAARIRELARGRPTVVLLIDALRDDRVGRPEFPALATLARDALRFTRTYANSSSTKSSLAAMLTGRLHPPLTTPGLGQRLRAAGKRPAFVGVHLEDDIGELYPVLRGFDPVRWIETEQQRSAWGSGVRERTSVQTTQQVLELLDQARPPDLILAHYFDVHQWHELFRGPRERAPERYDAAVRWVDQQLQPLLARRERINLVLVADHGEALNGLERMWHTTYVGAEVVRVPWLIRVPGVAPASVEAAIGLSELAPTLLDLLGVALPADFTGRSALALVGVAQPGFGPPIIALEPREWSILDGDLRLRYSPHSRSLWLHDVVADPDERADISSQQPQRAAALRSALLAAVRALEREHGPLRYGYDE